MTITLTIAPIIRPFRGFADPALPDGYWAAHGAVLGNASGGLMSVNIRMSTSAQPSVSLLWSLEGLMVEGGTGVDSSVRMDYGGFDLQPLQGSTGSLVKLVRIPLVVMGAGGLALSVEDLGLPIFLGAARKDVNVDLAFDVSNANGVSFGAFAQGFFWRPGAINAPGGPQRPQTSLYGS